MKKLPAMLLYTGDWKKDPALSGCTPATRGVWMDLLCAMHDDNRSGQISGTPDQLARHARCTPVELAAALDDLQIHRAADITCRNGVFTVTNRRMKRECNDRVQTRLRVTRHRNKEPCRSGVTADDDDCNTHSSSSSSVSEQQGKPTHPDLNTVIAWAETLGCPKAEAERFWNHFEASGWIDKNGHAIVNARAKLTTWAADARARPLERAHHASGHEPRAPSLSPSASLIHKQETLKRVEAAIARLRNNKPENGGTEFQAWLAKLRPLKDQAAALRQELGFPAV